MRPKARHEYEPDERPYEQRVKAAVKDIEGFVHEEMSYAAVKRAFPQHERVMDAALATSNLRYDPNQAAPSKVYPR